jgi:hypothetical protein
MNKISVSLLFFVQVISITSLAGAPVLAPVPAPTAAPAPAPAENTAPKDKDFVISQIIAQQGSLAEPLGGSYMAGEEIFKKANGIKEAQAFYKEKGLILLLNTGHKNPLGLCDEKIAQRLLLDPAITRLKVPSTGDIVSKNKQNYYDAAKAFTTAFNKQMLAFKKIFTPDC